jgi:hypothetical protein
MKYGSMQRLIPAAGKSFVFSQFLASLDRLWVPLVQAKGTGFNKEWPVIQHYAPFSWGYLYQ